MNAAAAARPSPKGDALAATHHHDDAATSTRADDERGDNGKHRAAAPLTLRGAWRYWLPPALAALLFTLLFLDPFAGDWDALDYTISAVHGQPSSMLFGRLLFIFTNHVAYRLAHALCGLESTQAYLLFKYMVVAQAPFAVVAMWTLARELTGTRSAATVAAFMLAVSPFFVVYSGQAMTETPALLLLCLALIVHLRGVRERKTWQALAGAALLGLCVNVREPVGFYGVWLVVAPLCYHGWRRGRRELSLTALACLIFFICALAPFATWWLLDVHGYRGAWHGWVLSMRLESAEHPLSVRNLFPFVAFFLIAAPVAFVALPCAARRERREHGWTPLLTLAVVGLFVNLVLLGNYSTVINGRYLLTGLPALLPLTAHYVVRRAEERTGNTRRGLFTAVTLVVVVALASGLSIYTLTAARQTLLNHALTGEYRTRLAQLPPDAVVMAGGQTVAVNYYRGLGLGRWDVIGTGGGWPGAAQLAPLIEAHLRQGRRVFVDVDPRLWSMNSWHERETRALVALQARFRFRRRSETLYEIRPTDDATATDDPQLQLLLNQPRPGGG